MRLIDADNLSELCDIMADKCESPTIWNQFRATVECSPTIDPMRHGRWVKGEFAPDSWEFCSICRFPKAVRRAQWYYCPSCGAKMDKGEDDG